VEMTDRNQRQKAQMGTLWTGWEDHVLDPCN